MAPRARSRSRSALPRTVLLALVALVATAFAATMAISATPSSGTIDQDRTTPLQWQGKELVGGATTNICGAAGSGSLPNCDEFMLTVDIDPIFWGSFDGGLEVGAGNDDPNDNLNILVYDNDGELVSSANASDAGQQEKVSVPKASRAGSPYRIVVYHTGVAGADGGTYNGGARIEARAAAPSSGAVGSSAPIPTAPVSGAKCVDGMAAGVFPCKGVDLDGFLPISSLGASGLTNELNDIWGWTDPETGKEYALVGKFNGTAFVDVSDPKAPKFLGELPTFGVEDPVFNIWRDIKTYKNKAYIVSEEPTHGMQVFDLTRLRGVTTPRTFTEDFHYAGFGSAHNISINEATGFAYVIGATTCDGGSTILDLNNLAVPVGPPVCVSGDGYTHDNQCVIYDGPDKEFTGHEICFDYNEDTVTIQDVTDKSAPEMLARIGYGPAQYTHQGWLTEDKRHLLFNDELDEQGNGTNTTTRILNIDKLRNPSFVGDGYVHPTKAIDHNNYVKGDRAYQANYRAGLRILDISKVATGDLSTEAFFDVYPADDDGEFNGSWSVYPFFKSGTVIVSGIEQGLFVLSEQRNTKAAAAQPTPTTTPAASAPGTPAAASPAAGAAATPSAAATPAAAAAAAGKAKAKARLRLTRRVFPGRRLRLGCQVTGASKRACVVRLYVRKGKKLALVKRVTFSSRTSTRLVRLRKARSLSIRATATTTNGATLKATRTLRRSTR